MNKELWKKCVEFHGHECPGLAIGFKASEAAREKMGLSFSKDEEVACVTENDACGVDAVQVITGCSMGKGNLIYKDAGKMAFTFFSRKSGEALRIVLKPWNRSGDRQKDMEYMLDAPYEELFDFKKPNFTVPENARLFNSIACESCGESTAECKIRIMDGKNVCGDCFKEYSRGF
ncbi:FmdE family protein [Clostridium magnum]|uniref:FmdE, molybdenum formylmethanofuran dehydrogenase operon n=1 Tax=Clostridium magnum DSM 2767 TaxID=1121326 RepID=A0A162TIB9_9CLOT|nr:FmdE family protein [Clostridium magnum]KZL92681.1 FmdE, molybdenum formylmethanofuran dehydrogenase operon [Clostridium magnum DSM 2767]SHI24441.1 formylmethanofuran dehydrogenase subunit E [Clostridium magnum DSM 2767]